jgi:hypothetical protein
MRGLPGSGRTQTAVDIAGDDGIIVPSPSRSADFDTLLSSGHSKIILDGDHITYSDIEDYIEKATENDYMIVLTYPSRSDAWDVSRCSEISGMSCEELEKMLEKFEF